MKRGVPVSIALAAITVCAMVVSFTARTSWLGTAGLGLLGTAAIGIQTVSTARWQRIWLWGMGLGWFFAWLIPARCSFALGQSPENDFYWNCFFSLMGWAAGVTILPASLPQADYLLKVRWKLPALICGAITGSLWLGAAYLHNLAGSFYLGVLFNLAWLTLALTWLRLPLLGIQAVITLMLLLAGLPMVDRFVAPPPKPDPHRSLDGRPFSFAAAKRDPLAFERWWECFMREMNEMFSDLFVLVDHDDVPFRLRPGGHSHIFGSEIVINSRGFRGREIPPQKGRAYRIVALGESTTFGCTLQRSDRPWPELLEELIRERLKPSRPVEVINAGTPCFSLVHNLGRLTPEDVLSLQPDLIISYHGFNGFHLLDTSLPPAVGKAPPAYRARPLNLLATCEYRLKMLLFRQSRLRRPGGPRKLPDVMETQYATAYRRLAETAQAKGIRLVIANYSMAANSQSQPGVLNFYRSAFPTVEWFIRANAAHSRLVQEIGRQYPSICLVDTHPGLDGEHEKFIDLIHFTQEGRQQIAETMFAGIRKLLEQDL